jgi:IS605 OrfB family transposase
MSIGETVMRKTYVKLRLTNEQVSYFDNVAEKVYVRASNILKTLISFRKKTASGYFISIDGEHFPVNLTDNVDLHRLYDLVAKESEPARTIRGPMTDAASKTGGKSGKDLPQLLKRLLENKTLPVKTLPEFSLHPNYDYAAFHMAVSGFKSWHECNERTESNYKKFMENLTNTQPDEEGLSAFRRWLVSNNIWITKKVASKFNRFGWDCYYYNWEQLKEINPDASYWAKIMSWQVKFQHSKCLRETSVCTLPQLQYSEREIPYGKNYTRFAMTYNGRNFVFYVDDMELVAMPTGYFRNLTVTDETKAMECLREPIKVLLKEAVVHFKNVDSSYRLGIAKVDEAIDKLTELVRNHKEEYRQEKLVDLLDRCNKLKTIPLENILGQTKKVLEKFQDSVIHYKFVYHRGNNSPLDESVTAHLKELMLFRKNNSYYIGLPMSVEVGESLQGGQQFMDYYFSTETEAECPNVRVMGVDLGIIDPAAWTIVDTTRNTIVADGIIGKNGNNFKFPWYVKRLKEFESKMKEIYQEINELADELQGYNIYCEKWRASLGYNTWEDWKSGSEWKEWIGKVQPIARKMNELKREMNQLRIPTLKIRNQEVTYEQILFILVYKKYIGILQRWTYFGSLKRNPDSPSEYRKSGNGFAVHYRRLNNLKRHLSKIMGCEIVRTARKNNVQVIVVENLEHFSPDAEKDSSENELLMLWGKGEMAKWIEHFAKQYNDIKVIKVDPRDTSQTDPLTGMYGYRFYSTMFFDRNGEIQKVNANLSASHNIALRAITRNEPFVKAVEHEDGYALWWDMKINNNTKRLKNSLVRKFGFYNVFIDKNGQPKKLKCIIKGITDISTDEEGDKGKIVYLYRLPKGWFPKDVKKEHQEQFREQHGLPKKPNHQARRKVGKKRGVVKVPLNSVGA